MGLLNDIYEDGVKWHDIACYHTKVMIYILLPKYASFKLANNL